jgi:leucine dehydrogenase
MSYKSAAADTGLGGGKAVIMADANTDKSNDLIRAYGMQVEALAGRYLTTTDVGSTTNDLETVSETTSYVVGLPSSRGGSGDTSVMTGLGVYMGMKASAKAKWGSDSLTGATVAMQGFGKVAYYTAKHLVQEGVTIIATDIFVSALDKAKSMGIRTVSPNDIYDVSSDIFSPCALGGSLNTKTIERLQCKIVAGGANNQLLTPEDDHSLFHKGILYAPDYVVNAGGIINASCEVGTKYSAERAKTKTLQIYDTLEQVFAISSEKQIPTGEAADMLAETRLRSGK